MLKCMQENWVHHYNINFGSNSCRCVLWFVGGRRGWTKVFETFVRPSPNYFSFIFISWYGSLVCTATVMIFCLTIFSSYIHWIKTVPNPGCNQTQIHYSESTDKPKWVWIRIWNTDGPFCFGFVLGNLLAELLLDKSNKQSDPRARFKE